MLAYVLVKLVLGVEALLAMLADGPGASDLLLGMLQKSAHR